MEYRLKKDFPGISAGTQSREITDFQKFESSEVSVTFHNSVCEKYSEWFEPVIDYKEGLKKMGWVVYEHNRKTALRLADDISIYADSFKDIYELLKEGSND